MASNEIRNIPHALLFEQNSILHIMNEPNSPKESEFNNTIRYTKQKDLMVFRFVSLQMRMSSPPSLAIDIHSLPKLPQGIYYKSANSKGSGGTALMSLCWSPM